MRHLFKEFTIKKHSVGYCIVSSNVGIDSYVYFRLYKHHVSMDYFPVLIEWLVNERLI